MLVIWLVAEARVLLPSWEKLKPWAAAFVPGDRSPDEKKTTTVQPAATPRSLPAGPAAAAARARAVVAYPQIAVAGSPLNRAFVARVIHYQVEKPHIFDDPEWPTTVARECELELRRPPVADSSNRLP